MNHLDSFELFELNKAAAYYRDHPDELHRDPRAEAKYSRFMYTPTLNNDTPSKYTRQYISKLAYNAGIDIKTLIPALACLNTFKYSTANYAIPSPYDEILRRLTVKPNNIPTKLWRGMRINAKGGKSVEEMAEIWCKGSKPGMATNRATSWTTDRNVAIEFMRKERGHFVRVLLRYDNPRLEDVIVDTREIKNDQYASEKEIILSGDATDYVVEESFPVYDMYGHADDPTEPFYVWLQQQRKHQQFFAANRRKELKKFGTVPYDYEDEE